MSQILGERDCGHGGATARELPPAAAAVAATLAAAAGSLLLVRRLGHAFPQPPGATAVAAVCGAGVLIVMLVDRIRHQGGPPFPAVLARLGLVLGVVAVALPPGSTAPLSLFVSGAAILTAGAAALAPLVRRRSRRLGERPTAGTAVGDTRAVSPAAAGRPQGEAAEPSGEIVPGDGVPGDIVQRFERRGLADGGEQVDAMVRVTVPRGARLGWAHVGFCPPFPATPVVEVATGYDGVEAIVSAAEVLPWGVRVEVRLDEPAEETIAVPVELAARTAA